MPAVSPLCSRCPGLDPNLLLKESSGLPSQALPLTGADEHQSELQW